jgi:hypothetical protein
MEGAAEVFENIHAAQTTLVPDGGATSRAKTKEDKLGLQNQVRGSRRVPSSQHSCKRNYSACDIQSLRPSYSPRPSRFRVPSTRVRGREILRSAPVQSSREHSARPTCGPAFSCRWY